MHCLEATMIMRKIKFMVVSSHIAEIKPLGQIHNITARKETWVWRCRGDSNSRSSDRQDCTLTTRPWSSPRLKVSERATGCAKKKFELTSRQGQLPWCRGCGMRFLIVPVLAIAFVLTPVFNAKEQIVIREHKFTNTIIFINNTFSTTLTDFNVSSNL